MFARDKQTLFVFVLFCHCYCCFQLEIHGYLCICVCEKESFRLRELQLSNLPNGGSLFDERTRRGRSCGSGNVFFCVFLGLNLVTVS